MEVNKKQGKGAAKSNPSPLFRSLKFEDLRHIQPILPHALSQWKWSSSNGKATFFPFLPMTRLHLKCVPLNLTHLFISFPCLLPFWQPASLSLYLWLCFCYVCSLFCFLDSIYKWNHTVYVFLCLVYFTKHNILQVHLCQKWQDFILFYG